MVKVGERTCSVQSASYKYGKTVIKRHKAVNEIFMNVFLFSVSLPTRFNYLFLSFLSQLLSYSEGLVTFLPWILGLGLGLGLGLENIISLRF